MAAEDKPQPTQATPPMQTPPVPPAPSSTTVQPSSPPVAQPQATVEPTIDIPPTTSEPTASVSTTSPTPSAPGGGAKNFVVGLFFGLIVAVLTGVGVYFWQSDLNKAEIDAANSKVTACEEEITKSLDAANVWKDQFVRLSQTVNTPSWIAEHCAELTLGEETETVTEETELLTP